MKIEYVHASDPCEEKIMDTEVQFMVDRNYAKVFCNMDDQRSQDEYDKWLMDKLEKQKAAGKIIRYKVVA